MPDTPVRSFVTDPDETRVQTVPFDLDGVILYGRRPKTAAYLATAELNTDQSLTDQMRGLRVFMDEVLVAESRDHIQERLDDPDDDFDVENLVPIINWVIEHFTARPTGRPTASHTQRRRTGSRSTAPARSQESTPSASMENAS